MLTFVLHVLPGGATWDYATQGEGWNAIGSGVGDAALLAGGVGLAVKAGKLVKAAGAIESVIGLYRSGEAIHLVVQEDYIGAAGSAGEALLRFLGAGAHLSAAKRLAAPASKAVQQGYRRVYRAVSEAEYQDILRTGQFRQGPNSLEGKWFADTVESAHAHGKALFGEGKFRLIEADVPKNAPSLFLHPNMDGFGPARFLDLNDLRRVRPRPVE